MITALVVVVVVAVGVWWRRRRDPSRTERHQVEVVAVHLARALRTGDSVHAALAHTAELVDGELGRGLGAAADAVARGVPLDTALVRWAATGASRRDDARRADLELLVAATRFGASQGGDLAAALEGVALVLVDRRELAQETVALTSQARASAAVLCALPAVGAVLFSSIDRRVTGVLFGTSIGWACLGIALLLDALAVSVVMALVARASR